MDICPKVLWPQRRREGGGDCSSRLFWPYVLVAIRTAPLCFVVFRIEVQRLYPPLTSGLLSEQTPSSTSKLSENGDGYRQYRPPMRQAGPLYIFLNGGFRM